MSSDSETDCTSASQNCHFTCPRGGTWYVCPDEPYFVGCCSSDPCTNSNTTSPCPDVYAASYDAGAFGGTIFDSIRPNTCIDRPNTNWFTCNFTSPPFIGCCASNPCSEGCPDDDVLQASWSSSRNDQYQLFRDLESDNDDTDSGSDGLSGGAIAGIVVGVVCGVAILAAALWFWRRKKKNAARGGKFGFTPEGGRGHPVSGEGEVQSMYTGVAGSESGYGGYGPNSPYQDSHFSSPSNTVAGTPSAIGSKYPSGFSGQGGLSPPLGSEAGRPISEIGSEGDFHAHGRGSGGHGLGVFGAKPPTIQELDSTARPAEVHEMEDNSRK
ncbi:uncharacterized protein BDV14DRAFT_8622 [Aspergillus stella-maris]|uniref:uncharacterized protein n=1 Tax=Aspergillus stella-maris TaxID=1810926 RepID=UPI003CCD7125